jgi:hypothetical protein
MTMDVIERSKFVDDEGKISLTHRISATLDYGLDWYRRMEAQDAVTQRLGRAFKDEHILMRNVPIPGVDEGEPYMILIGPQGIRILMTFPILGVFRANEREWLKLDQRSRSFIRTKPNLLTLALNIQKQVTRLLEIQNFRAPVAESVLIFTHPRTLIDGTRPACRIVSADAIEYFAANLEKLPGVINSQQIHTLVDAILYPKLPDPQSARSLITDPEMKKPTIPQEGPRSRPAFYPDAFSEDDEASFVELDQDDFLEDLDLYTLEEEPFQEFTSTTEAPRTQRESSKPPGRFGMSRIQWLIIGFLVIVEIIIILYFAMVVLEDLGML